MKKRKRQRRRRWRYKTSKRYTPKIDGLRREALQQQRGEEVLHINDDVHGRGVEGIPEHYGR
jgi:hypothetical protein